MVTIQDFYDGNEDFQKEFLRNSKKRVKEVPALKKMELIIKKNMTAYTNDFYVHDVQLMNESLKEHNAFDFIWFVRKRGTHFINLKSIHSIQESVQALRKLNGTFYHIKGTSDIFTFHVLSDKELENIVSTHEEKTEKAFELFKEEKLRLMQLGKIPLSKITYDLFLKEA